MSKNNYCNPVSKEAREAGKETKVDSKVISSIANSMKAGRDTTDDPTKEELKEEINRRKKSVTTFWSEDNVSEDTKKVSNEKASKMQLFGQTGYGANTIWSFMAKRYGILDSNIHKVDISDWDSLSFEDKEKYNMEYEEVMKSLGRTYVSLSKLDPVSAKTARMHRGKVIQVHKADAVFVLGEIVNPGEKSTPLFGSKSYENKADFPAVAGDNGITVQLAIKNGKPVHIFDSKDYKWKTWDGSKFIEEDTPKLTNAPIVLGMRGNLKEKSFSKSIGEENFNAIMEVFRKTFNYKIKDAGNIELSGISVDDLNEERQELVKEAEEYTPSIDYLADSTDDEISRINIELNPQERAFRVEMLSREFSSTIDEIIDEELDNIEGNMSTALAEYNKARVDLRNANKENKKEARRVFKEKEKAYYFWNDYNEELNDEFKRRKAVIKKIGIDAIFKRIKDSMQEIAESEENEVLRDKYQKVVDNFNILMQEAMEKVQDYENFRIIPYKKVSGKIATDIGNSSEEELNNEEEFSDDEIGSRATGNDGWSFKIRFTDPKRTVSELTKRALNSIVMKDSDGNDVYDDLGMLRYMNGNYAHSILMNELSDMIDADDFSVVDSNGNYVFPALEKIKGRYSWVENVISMLETDPNLVGTFFHDFNMTYIQYAKLDSDGVPMPLNQPIAIDSALNSLIRNVENSIILGKNSLYNELGEINMDNAKVLKDSLSQIYEDIKSERISFVSKNYTDDQGNFIKDSDEYQAASQLADILRSLGFETSTDHLLRYLPSLIEIDDSGISKFSKLINSINSILNPIISSVNARENNKKNRRKKIINKDSAYLQTFTKEFRQIASIVGEVSELDNVQSFKDGNKSRYSYSAPNYISNWVKKIKSNSRRDLFLENEYAYDELFYDKKNKKWRNKFLEDYSKNDAEGEYLRRFLEVSEVIGVTSVNNLGMEESIPYADWDDTQTYEVMFSKYFSRRTDEGSIQLADYNFPIFSDSPASMFITARKYVSTSDQTYKEQLLPLFREVVKQEIRRIAKVTKRNAARANGSNEPGLAEIQNYDKKGTEFNFFPELNKLEVDGQNFRDTVLKMYAKSDMDSIDSITDRVLPDVIDNLFNEFIDDVDLTYFEDRLKTWGVTKYSKEEEKSKEYPNISRTRTIEALEEYFWNSTYATSQIIQIMTSDLAFYKNPVDFQKRFKEVYASGKRLNTNTKYGRKLENTIYISDIIATSNKYDSVKRSLNRAIEEGRMKRDQVDWILRELKKINVADAQAYRNPYAFRAILDMMGKWTDEMDESFNRIINGEWDSKDFAIIWQTVKPFIFTNVRTPDGVGGESRVPHQNKNSEYLVLSFYDMIAASTSDSNILRGIGKFFDKHPEIDVIQFESAVKVGGQGIVNIMYNNDQLEAWIDSDDEISTRVKEEAKSIYGNKYENTPYFNIIKSGLDSLLDKGEISQEEYNDYIDDIENTDEEVFDVLENVIKDKTNNPDGEYDMNKGVFNKNVIHQLPYADYMVAQPTPEHLIDIEDATSGSQFRNLILANITDPNFSITVNGKKLNKQQMFDLYRGAIVDNLLDSFEEVTGIFKDIHNLQQYLYKLIQGNPKYGTDVIEALRIIKVKHPLEDRYIEVFNLPPDLPTISNQIQELFTSVFKNKITKQKIKGGNCIQVSCAGLSRKLSVLRDKDDNIIGAECMLPSWSKKFFLPFLVERVSENGTRYQELDIEAMREKAPDLMKMVGYRIPTENKYSMLPLIVKGFLPQQNGSAIMLPADITLIAGSDFDVDKMFLRIPAFEVDDNGNPIKISYNLNNLDNSDTISMSKLQRDNLMIDIEYAVLTSKEGSEQVFKPGNANTLKSLVKKLKIINDPEMLTRVLKENTNLNDDEIQDVVTSDFDTLYDVFENRFNKTIDLDKYIKEKESAINILSPKSFVYFHKQNMVGSALIGLYANGSSVHTKAQETDLSINDDNVFTVNGKEISSLHDIMNSDNQYIQDLIAELQSASVDNAKDPVLADLNQNMSTAGTALFMLRAGMNLSEMALMFNAVKPGLSLRTISSIYKFLTGGKKYKPALNVDSKLLLKVSMYNNLYPNIINALKIEDKEKLLPELYKAFKEYGISRDQDKIYDILNSLYIVYNLYSHINNLKSELKIGNDIMKADSPNNAIATGYPAALRQRRQVDIAEVSINSKKYPFRNSSGLYSTNMDNFVSNGVINNNMDRAEMRKRLMDRKLSSIQAFYSLGIELPIYTMGKLLIQGNPELGLGTKEIPGVLGRIMNNSETGNMSESQINEFYREFMQFVMTKTKTFGDNFNLRRQYYLSEFPAKLKDIRKNNKEIYNNPVASRLNVNLRTQSEASIITYKRIGSRDKSEKAFIRRSLNSMLYSSDPEVVKFANDLFMYSFYSRGFNYGPNSFGTYFDVTFWNRYPEALQVLRTFKYNNRELSSLFNNFMEQYLANHSDDVKDSIIKVYKAWDASQKPVVQNDNSVLLRAGNCYNKYNSGYNEYTRIEVAPNDFRLYKIDASSLSRFMEADAKIRYVPVPIFDEYLPVYDANSNVTEMSKLYFNDRKAIIRRMEEEAETSSKTNLSKVSGGSTNAVLQGKNISPSSSIAVDSDYFNSTNIDNSKRKSYAEPITKNWGSIIDVRPFTDSDYENNPIGMPYDMVVTFQNGEKIFISPKSGMADTNNVVKLREDNNLKDSRTFIGFNYLLESYFNSHVDSLSKLNWTSKMSEMNKATRGSGYDVEKDYFAGSPFKQANRASLKFNASADSQFSNVDIDKIMGTTGSNDDINVDRTIEEAEKETIEKENAMYNTINRAEEVSQEETEDMRKQEIVSRAERRLLDAIKGIDEKDLEELIQKVEKKNKEQGKC